MFILRPSEHTRVLYVTTYQVLCLPRQTGYAAAGSAVRLPDVYRRYVYTLANDAVDISCSIYNLMLCTYTEQEPLHSTPLCNRS